MFMIRQTNQMIIEETSLLFGGGLLDGLLDGLLGCLLGDLLWGGLLDGLLGDLLGWGFLWCCFGYKRGKVNMICSTYY